MVTLLACAGAGSQTMAASHPDALLYVAIGSANAVDIFPRNDHRQPIGRITQGIDKPGALATDAAGTLYVGNANNTVTAYPLGSASPSLTYSQGIAGPNYLATGRDGSLYVSNGVSQTVEQFPPGAVTPLRTITFNQPPAGISVDSAGDLFVITGGTDIERFAPGETKGHSLGFGLPEGGMNLAVTRHGDFLVDLPDYGVVLFARAKPHAHIGVFGFLYTQQGSFTLAPDDDGLYLSDPTEGRVVQIAYPDTNFADVIGNLGNTINGVAVTPKTPQ